MWIETLSSLEEVDAALTASDKSGMKAVITMSFDTAKKTMMGVSPYEFVKFINNRRNKPLAIGANCGIGPSELLISMKEIKDHFKEARDKALKTKDVASDDGLEMISNPLNPVKVAVYRRHHIVEITN